MRMEVLLMYDLFFRPFENVENRIEILTANVAFVLIKAFFVVAVLKKEDFYKGYLKIIIFAIHFFQRHGQESQAMKLLCVKSFILYILADSENFLLSYIITVLLFLDSNNTFLIETILLQSLGTYCFRYILSFSDVSVIISGVVWVVVYYTFMDNYKHTVDLVLFILLFIILRSVFDVVPINDSLLFRALILTYAWMMLKYQGSMTKLPKVEISANIETESPVNVNDLYIINIKTIVVNIINHILISLNQYRSIASHYLTFCKVTMQNALFEIDINNVLPEIPIYDNLFMRNSYNSMFECYQNDILEVPDLRNMASKFWGKFKYKFSPQKCSINGDINNNDNSQSKIFDKFSIALERCQSKVNECKISKNIIKCSQCSNASEMSSPKIKLNDSNTSGEIQSKSLTSDSTLSFAPIYTSTFVPGSNPKIISKYNYSKWDHTPSVISECNARIVSDFTQSIESETNHNTESNSDPKILTYSNVTDSSMKILSDCNHIALLATTDSNVVAISSCDPAASGCKIDSPLNASCSKLDAASESNPVVVLNSSLVTTDNILPVSPGTQVVASDSNSVAAPNSDLVVVEDDVAVDVSDSSFVCATGSSLVTASDKDLAVVSSSNLATGLNCMTVDLAHVIELAATESNTVAATNSTPFTSNKDPGRGSGIDTVSGLGCNTSAVLQCVPVAASNFNLITKSSSNGKNVLECKQIAVSKCNVSVADKEHFDANTVSFSNFSTVPDHILRRTSNHNPNTKSDCTPCAVSECNTSLLKAIEIQPIVESPEKQNKNEIENKIGSKTDQFFDTASEVNNMSSIPQQITYGIRHESSCFVEQNIKFVVDESTESKVDHKNLHKVEESIAYEVEEKNEDKNKSVSEICETTIFTHIKNKGEMLNQSYILKSDNIICENNSGRYVSECYLYVPEYCVKDTPKS